MTASTTKNVVKREDARTTRDDASSTTTPIAHARLKELLEKSREATPPTEDSLEVEISVSESSDT